MVAERECGCGVRLGRIPCHAKCRLTRGTQGVGQLGMANLTLVYGMRLLPADEVASVGEAPVR